MLGKKAVGAVISGGIPQREHLFAAIFANKSVIVLGKTLGFHKIPPKAAFSAV
jgi:hypothetical protein